MSAAKPLPTLEEIKSRCKILDNGCWIWQGALANGYPCIRRGNVHYKVHRLSYEIANNTKLGAKQANHKCDTKRCANPDHIKPGTYISNRMDHDRVNLPKGGIHLNNSGTGTGWRAKITIHGTSYRKQFPTKVQAQEWLDDLVKEKVSAKCYELPRTP